MNLQLKKQLELKYPQLLANNFAGVDLCFTVQLDNLLSFVTKLNQELAEPRLVDIVAAEVDRAQSHLDLTYLFLSLEHQLLVAVQTTVDKSDVIPSISSIWSDASFREHEVFDFFKLKFSSGVMTRLYCHHQMKQFPMVEKVEPFSYMSMSDIDLFPKLKDGLRPEQTILNIGPTHPLLNCGMRALAKVQDESILQLEIEVGLQHKGIEKSASQMTPDRLVHLGSFMGLSFADSLNCAVAMCLEQISGLKISKRAEVIRTFLLELERLAEHLDSFVKLSVLFESRPLMAVCLRARDYLAEVRAKLTGKRMSGGAIRLGGAIDIFKNTILHDLFESIDFLLKEVATLESLFCSKKSWRDILEGGEISRSFAISKSLVGPNLRASGVNWDWRKRRPYYFYGDLKFEVPCGVEGTNYDRYVVRLFEMKESLSIMQQLLESIPSGRSLASHSESFKDMKKTKSYLRIEGPQGELGVFVYFNAEGQVTRCKISPSTISSAFALSELAPSHSLDAFSSIFLSLGINPTEMDR